MVKKEVKDIKSVYHIYIYIYIYIYICIKLGLSLTDVILNNYYIIE